MNRTHTQVLTVHSGDLILVNASHPHYPQATVPHTELLLCDPAGVTAMAPRAAKMLDFCLGACGAVGQILPTSGYRPHAEQTALYAETLKKRGDEFTKKYVALPGCSEHETGLAVDLASAKGGADAICPDLPNTGIFARFRALAADYGFIERYPEGKTALTGIGYEPWHFRYVGWPHSKIIIEQDLVLEQYIAQLQNHTGEQNALTYRECGREVRIFTVYPDKAQDTAEALAGRGLLWQASGNNVDGVVVTVWM